MADNYVQIQIKASDTAKPDLTSLKAQLDELGAKAETAKVDVDDTDGTAKLLAINAKLAALNAKVAKPNITVAGAAKAEADLAAVDASLQHLSDDSKKADSSSANLRSRLMSFGGATASVTGVGDAMTAASSKSSMFQRVMAGASLATGLLEAPMAGVVVATGGLVSGLAAAGAGLGVFGLVAGANYTAASTAAKAVQTAQDTYNASIKAGIPQAKAYQAEQKAIGVAYAELSPQQIALSKQIGDMSNTWQSFVQANTAGTAKVMEQGMGLLPKILQAIQPLMAPVEAALSRIIAQLSKGLDSSGFKSFMASLTQNTGPAIEKLATAIGHVVVGIGGILKAFMPVSQGVLSGVDKITAEFAKWGSSLTSHSGFQSLMSTFKTEVPLVLPILKNLGTVILNIGKAMTGLATGSNSKALLQVLGPLSGTLATLSKNTNLVRVALYTLAAVDVGKKLSGMFQGIQSGLGILSGAVGVIGKFGKAAEDASVGAKLAAAATRVWTGVQAALDVVMDANPIMLVVIAIAALVAGVIYAYTHFQTFRDAVNDVGNFLKTVFVDALHAVETAVKAVGDFIVHAWDAVKTFFTVTVPGWWDTCVNFLSTKLIQPIENGLKAAWSWIETNVGTPLNTFFTVTIPGYWTDCYNFIVKTGGDVITFFTGLPKKILAAIGNFAILLVQAGKDLLTGLINGIESMVSTVVTAAMNVGKSILSGIKSALGLGSPSRITHQHGVWLAQGLIEGMDSMHGPLNAAATRMAGGALPGGYGAAGGAAGKMQMELQLTGSGDQFLVWLRNAIRVKGGTGPNGVQVALGQSR